MGPSTVSLYYKDKVLGPSACSREVGDYYLCILLCPLFEGKVQMH